MCNHVTVPSGYRPVLNIPETQSAIELTREIFQNRLAETLNLRRVTAPLMVQSGTGINDDLDGVEKPISFPIRHMPGIHAEIVQSLAKWKRLALAEMGLPHGEGILTDMNALRPGERPDNLHSLYVDQWDWERVIRRDDRTPGFLKQAANLIYQAVRDAERHLGSHHPVFEPVLPESLTCLHSAELRDLFPQLSPREREIEICRDKKAVFLTGIGAALADGLPHDGRAPDYDDWSTPGPEGPGLNGDILLWHEPLHTALEITSMGIRVDREILLHQLEITGTTERKNLKFHRLLLEGRLPLSIGGGIGQSRLCMFLLRKAHIGEVQAGLWPDSYREACLAGGIPLL